MVETLPIGRRLAFDAAQGRLWVVCRHCAKWNLVPFESRLESIDACERLFRDTPTRYSTDNIGLARVKEGLELVRIGPAMRPEFAGWRYGDQFGRRRRRNILLAAGLALAPPAIMGLGLAAGVSFVSLLQWPSFYYQWRLMNKVTVRLPREGLPPVEMTDMQVSAGRLIRRSGHELTFRTTVNPTPFGQSSKRYELVGDELDRILPLLLARVNLWTSKRSTIKDAVTLVTEQPQVRDLLEAADTTAWSKRLGRAGMLGDIKPAWRLAAEIASNEVKERTALEGELALLEREWKQAEELAKISDKLALPE
ncbi:MAG: hypothetical protein SFU84_07875 [Gemmatimonadales bacterium]|nr:hypothetical protein [Gemmatimonadales bacterium]